MHFSEENSSARYQIKKYDPGCITVNEQEYRESILLMSEFLGPCNRDNFLRAFEMQPEVIIIGTGDKLEIPPQLIDNEIGLEIMTTAAACRTYTILISEQRNVLAALLL